MDLASKTAEAVTYIQEVSFEFGPGQQLLSLVGFEVLTAVIMNSSIFGDISP
jgi:hypothetical protein